MSSRSKRAKRAEPVILVRSPTFTNSDLRSIVKGSKPDKRQAFGMSGMTRGGYLATFSAMARMCAGVVPQQHTLDRKSTRLNSSHVRISYAVLCLKKKKKHTSKL